MLLPVLYQLDSIDFTQLVLLHHDVNFVFTL